MKKILAGLSGWSAIVGLAIAGEPFGTIVGTSSVCILPAVDAQSAGSAWSSVTGRVVQAGTVLSNGGVSYFAVNTSAATASNAPSHLTGMTNGDDNIVWQVCPAVKSARQGLCITKASTNGTAYVSVGRPAVASQGIALVSNGDKVIIASGAPQSAVFVLSGATNDLIVAQDW